MKDSVGTHGPCVRNIPHADCSDRRGQISAADGNGFGNDAQLMAAHPQRKSPRAEFHDYSGGSYFVTVCTQNKTHYFWEIHNEKMHLSPIGEYCTQQLENVSAHYPYAEIPLYVVMPNHIHAIIRIDDNEPVSADSHRTHGPCVDGSDKLRTHGPCVPTQRTALSVVIGGLKRAVTMFAQRNNIEFRWQGRYHDHIIRGTRDGNLISEYIENNVARWASDCFQE